MQGDLQISMKKINKFLRSEGLMTFWVILFVGWIPSALVWLIFGAIGVWEFFDLDGSTTVLISFMIGYSIAAGIYVEQNY